MERARDIVETLAGLTVEIDQRTHYECKLCGETNMPAGGPVAHALWCPWARARRWSAKRGAP
jgi:hypothetical protein